MPLHYDGEIRITKINMGPYNNNGYIVVCPETNEGVIIDTPAEPEKLLDAIGDVQIKSILITHKHQDHLLGFDEITGAIGAPVAIGVNDVDGLPRAPEVELKDGAVIKFGNREMQVLDTPGHTEGGTCFLIGQAPVFGGYSVPRRTGQDPQPRGVKPAHRQHHQEALGLARRYRGVSGPRRRHHHRQSPGRVPGLRIDSPSSGYVRGCGLAG